MFDYIDTLPRQVEQGSSEDQAMSGALPEDSESDLDSLQDPGDNPNLGLSDEEDEAARHAHLLLEEEQEEQQALDEQQEFDAQVAADLVDRRRAAGVGGVEDDDDVGGDADDEGGNDSDEDSVAELYGASPYPPYPPHEYRVQSLLSPRRRAHRRRERQS